MGYGLGEMDERRLVGADGRDDERFGGMGGGIVLTQEVTVKRSASNRGRGARGRAMGLNDVAEDMDAGSSMGDLTTVGDDIESIGKRSGRSIE